MSELAACTIVSKNYLPFARVLARSFHTHHPGGRFFVLLVDRVDGYFDPGAEPFELVEVEQLDNIPDLGAFLFKYTILELNTAVKPYLLEHLFAEHGVTKLLYLDPDILVMRPLAALDELLGHAAIVLTPHLTAPYDDAKHPDELAILRSGSYNLGFLGLADRQPVSAFLKWWQSRVFDGCVVRVEEGLFVDQKWIDLVPGMYDGVAIVRDPGYNVAYWNLHSRRVALGDDPTCNGEPLYFFHFSGVEPQNLETVSRHQDRFRLKDLGGLRELFTRYRDLLFAEGYRETRPWPYAYAAFDDGTTIPDVARALYLSLGNAAARFGDPFAAAGDSSFLAWLNAPVRGHGPGHVTRLLFHLHQSSPALRQFFPDPCGNDLVRFAEWFDVYGRQDFQLPDAFLEPMAPVLAASGDEGIERPARKGLRHAYDSQAARRFKDWLKRVLGPRATQALKRMVRPLATGHPEESPEAAPAEPSGIDLSRVGINVTGYIRTETGIGEGLRGLIRAIEHTGIPHTLVDVNLGVAARMEDGSFEDFSSAYDYGINVFGINADQVQVVAPHVGLARFAGRYNIGCWSWELESFPDEWTPCFDYFDEIWTPSRFCVDSIGDVAPIPVRRMPHSVELDAEPDADRARFGLPEDRFVFLFVFDFLSFFQRKNPLAVVRAFKRAFTGDEQVLLVLKTTNSEREPAAHKALEREIDGAPIELLDRYLDRDDVYALMASCDAYVSLHRSEGFGLTMAEAMLLGKPVVATAYSGNTDFMDVNNSLPVRYRLVELERDHGPYQRGNCWAEPDENHAAELMRLLLHQPNLVQRLGDRARADIRAQLSREAVGRIVRRRVEEILRRHPPGPGLTHPSGRGV